MAGKIADAVEIFQNLAGERVDFVECGDGVEIELDADGGFVVGWKDFDGVAADAEFPAREIELVALVVIFAEAAEQLGAVDDFAFLDDDGHLRVEVGRAQAVDAGDAGDDDHVGARHQRGGRGEAQTVDVFVDGGIFFDVDIPRRNIGFGLVVVVVADEVGDSVVGEEGFEFAVELRGERLVVAEHQRGFLHALNQVRHREGLAGAGDTQEGLVAQTFLQTVNELLDGGGLVTGGGVSGSEFEHREKSGF